uniref:Uncharacterized protein n=1 Tax=Rhizophora mucronata TaxID=61149 RepID=A0A2P2QMP3_RHIMU
MKETERHMKSSKTLAIQ